jgi:hypothetical protein
VTGNNAPAALPRGGKRI